MSVRVAVASKDGKVIHQHFGRAEQFLVFELDGTVVRFMETRSNQAACGLPGEGHDPERLHRTIRLVADCQAVLARDIGPGAAELLIAQGTRPFVVFDYIGAALKALVEQNVFAQE
jgi:nitrogen fixation protein NifX